MKQSKILITFYLLLFILPCIGQGSKGLPHILVKDVIYISNDTLKADFYLPVNYKQQQNPVLIFGDGYGVDFRNWDHYTNWAKLAASKGFISIIYCPRKEEAKANLRNLLNFIIKESNSYFIDSTKISLYAGSGSVLEMLPFANEETRIKAAMMYYGAPKMENFRLNMPVLLVRAGLDNPQLNKALDTLAFKALQAFAPYTIVSFNTATHPFEDIDDPEIRKFMIFSLDFLKTSLSKPLQDNISQKESIITASRELYHSNWKTALAALQAALKNDPSNSDIEQKIGNVYMELEEYDKAIKAFNDALAHGSWRKGEIAKKKCIAYAALNDVENAIGEMKILRNIGRG